MKFNQLFKEKRNRNRNQVEMCGDRHQGSVLFHLFIYLFIFKNPVQHMKWMNDAVTLWESASSVVYFRRTATTWPMSAAIWINDQLWTPPTLFDRWTAACSWPVWSEKNHQLNHFHSISCLHLCHVDW